MKFFIISLIIAFLPAIFFFIIYNQKHKKFQQQRTSTPFYLYHSRLVIFFAYWTTIGAIFLYVALCYFTKLNLLTHIVTILAICFLLFLTIYFMITKITVNEETICIRTLFKKQILNINDCNFELIISGSKYIKITKGQFKYKIEELDVNFEKLCRFLAQKKPLSIKTE